MIYFDTDVLINYFVEQDVSKNQQSIRLFHEATSNGHFFCSLLCLQELSFVLSKLKVPNDIIENLTAELLTPFTANYTIEQYQRAVQPARKVGFQNINDCLHTAIAETYCQELYTFFNYSDFKRIQNYTNLKITIL